MIQILDRIDCSDLERSIVKSSAFKRAVLIQDVDERETLFGLLFVDDARAVLVRAGNMNLDAGVGGRNQLLRFRNELDRAGVSSRELRFCAPGTYKAAWNAQTFDPAWLIDESIADLAQRFSAWRAGRAEW